MTLGQAALVVFAYLLGSLPWGYWIARRAGLAVVDHLTSDDLRRCAARTGQWHDAGAATPLILEASEFGRSLDAYEGPIFERRPEQIRIDRNERTRDPEPHEFAVDPLVSPAWVLPREARDESRAWLEFAGLGRRATAFPHELNLHERKFLELARALAAKPKLLLLDEVLSGLNPAEVDNAIRLVRAIRAQGATIVFVEHLMRAVVELSDRIAVLNEGRLFALGLPREVMGDPRVVSIYLGKAYA